MTKDHAQPYYLPMVTTKLIQEKTTELQGKNELELLIYQANGIR